MAQKKIAFSLCAIISHHACPGKEGILGCHPDLAGRDLQRGTLTRESRGEQAQAGLDALESAEMSRMARLNGEYKERFGFPFVICARMCDKANILQQLSQRARGGEEVKKIGRLRLQGLVLTGSPDKLCLTCYSVKIPITIRPTRGCDVCFGFISNLVICTILPSYNDFFYSKQ